MRATHARHFRHPRSFEQALLTCDIRGENNYVVACYRGSDQSHTTPLPSDVIRGGVQAAREAWARIQKRLTADGFVVVRSAEEEYQRGYKDGTADRPFDKAAGKDYEDGWHDGEPDRPTMDDFIDPEKERTDPFGY